MVNSIYDFIESKEIREYFQSIDFFNKTNDISLDFDVIYNSILPIDIKLDFLKELIKNRNGCQEDIIIVKKYIEYSEEVLSLIYNNSDIIFCISQDKYKVGNDYRIDTSSSFEFYYSLNDIMDNYNKYPGDENDLYNINILLPKKYNKKQYNDPDKIGLNLAYFNKELKIYNIYFGDYFDEDLNYDLGFRYPLPFKNGEEVVLWNKFLDKPIYGKINSELDPLNCWYHFLEDENGETIEDLSYNDIIGFPGSVFDSLYSKEYFKNSGVV